MTGQKSQGRGQKADPTSVGGAADSKLRVKVFSPFQNYYEGEALSVSGINQTGPFDVLVNHANFFSLLEAGDVTINTGYREFKFKISHGIIKVTNNVVTMFVGV